MKRYEMIGIPGGHREYESDTGQWVKYNDIADILDALCISEEAINHAEKLIAKRETISATMPLRMAE